MSADLLRRAASLMRERAEAAFSSPWHASDGAFVEVDESEGDYYTVADTYGTKGNAEHIASWHPAVALAVADWLEQHAPAHSYASVEAGRAIVCPAVFCQSITLARAYLGEDA